MCRHHNHGATADQLGSKAKRCFKKFSEKKIYLYLDVNEVIDKRAPRKQDD